MGLFDRVSRVVRSNLNAAVSAAEDPAKILDQAIIDMQEDLVQMRQSECSNRQTKPKPKPTTGSSGRN
jgi:phage shock protein A